MTDDKIVADACGLDWHTTYPRWRCSKCGFRTEADGKPACNIDRIGSEQNPALRALCNEAEKAISWIERTNGPLMAAGLRRALRPFVGKETTT